MGECCAREAIFVSLSKFARRFGGLSFYVSSITASPRQNCFGTMPTSKMKQKRKIAMSVIAFLYDLRLGRSGPQTRSWITCIKSRNAASSGNRIANIERFYFSSSFL
jgi:hypothetical protein